MLSMELSLLTENDAVGATNIVDYVTVQCYQTMQSLLAANDAVGATDIAD